MQITRKTLENKIAQLTAQKDGQLQAAEKMRQQERLFLDNANAAHGAIQAIQSLIKELDTPEERPFIPPVPVTAGDVALDVPAVAVAA